MIKICLLYVNCGSGHRMAAQSLYSRLRENKNNAVKLIDLGKFSSFPGFYERGYRIIVTKFPFLWHLLYNLYSHALCGKIVFWFNLISFARFFRYLNGERPDVVISTHFFASSLVSYYKKRHADISLRLMTVVTDFGVYPLWVNPYTDYYFVASSDTREQMIRDYGVEKEKVIVSGIPVREQFFHPLDRRELSKKYALPLDKFCVFIFSSDMGVGPIKKVIEELKDEVGVLVSYGNNLQLKEHLEKIARSCRYLRIFGRIEAIWEVMELADVVVTKAGGISVSECLVKKKPMVFIYVFYGQEERNVEFILKKKMGFRPSTALEVVELLRNLKDNPSQFSRVRQRLINFDFPDAADKIASILSKL